MHRERFLLDTNALVALLEGHEALITLTKEADWLGVSVVNVLEFLGFNGLTEPDRHIFTELLSRIRVVDLKSADTALMRTSRPSEKQDLSNCPTQLSLPARRYIGPH